MLGVVLMVQVGRASPLPRFQSRAVTCKSLLHLLYGFQSVALPVP
jgi:hypothetical protein